MFSEGAEPLPRAPIHPPAEPARSWTQTCLFDGGQSSNHPGCAISFDAAECPHAEAEKAAAKAEPKAKAVKAVWSLEARKMQTRPGFAQVSCSRKAA